MTIKLNGRVANIVGLAILHGCKSWGSGPLHRRYSRKTRPEGDAQIPDQIGIKSIFSLMEFLTEEQARIKVESCLKESLKRYPLLADFVTPLEFVFFEFYIKGGHVRYDENLKSSIFEPVLLYGRRVSNLVIGAKERKYPMEIIWSSFHEWGHLSQPPQTDEIRLNPQLTYFRESEAWDIAELKMEEYPSLVPHLYMFYAHRDYCLNDYHSKIPK